MAKISFIKNKISFEVPLGTNLMRALLQQGLPVASSCDGDGVCSKCRIKIIEGAANLSPEQDVEMILKEQNNVGRDYRISCQAEVQGDITVDTNYW